MSDRQGSAFRDLSPAQKTRQTRQILPDLLIPLGQPMSGCPKKPDKYPTFARKNPTSLFVSFRCRIVVWQENASPNVQYVTFRTHERSAHGQRSASFVNGRKQALFPKTLLQD